jgi:3-oxoacyl-[acyl-carrier-protein] synthase-1
MAVARLLRQRKASFDLWHPAEGIGETGAVATIAMIAVAWHANRKGYGPGPRMLLHAGSDGSERIAAIFEGQGEH